MGIFKNQKCLVLGASGFIGKHFTNTLLAQGASVLAVHAKEYSSEKCENCRYLQLNLSDMSDCVKLQRDSFHYIFNLSGYVDHTPFFSGGRSVIKNHYEGLMNVLEVIDRSELKGFVQIGSSDEYGNQPSPQMESTREAPISPYSCAKVSASHLIQMLAKTEGFPGVVLRFFLVYGPGQGQQRFLPQILF